MRLVRGYSVQLTWLFECTYGVNSGTINEKNGLSIMLFFTCN